MRFYGNSVSDNYFFLWWSAYVRARPSGINNPIPECTSARGVHDDDCPSGESFHPKSSALCNFIPRFLFVDLDHNYIAILHPQCPITQKLSSSITPSVPTREGYPSPPLAPLFSYNPPLTPLPPGNLVSPTPRHPFLAMRAYPFPLLLPIVPPTPSLTLAPAPTPHLASPRPRRPGRCVPPHPHPRHRQGYLPRHAPDPAETRTVVPNYWDSAFVA